MLERRPAAEGAVVQAWPQIGVVIINAVSAVTHTSGSS
jgi:hypothetical protein